MRFSLLGVIYIVVGVLVATGTIGDHGNFFHSLDSIEEIVSMLLAVFLWPLVLLGVDVNIGNSMANGGKGK